METRRRVLLFRRDFRAPSGGHLKVWHYVGHAAASRTHRPLVHLTAASRRGEGNPFDVPGDHGPIAEWCPERADTLFLAGLDWASLPEPATAPVINLVQGLRHARAGDPRRAFLGRRAIRICVSDEVADAIKATGEVEGPVFTIPNGVDVEPTGGRRDDRGVGLLVAGWKDPPLTAAVVERLRQAGREPAVIANPVPREEFLARLADAEVAVLIPLGEEGCFLPALEAFALGCLVVCPDCGGNRGFCRDGESCLRPSRDAAAIVAATERALAMDREQRDRLRSAALEVARGRTLVAERRAFLAILDNLDAIW